VRLPNLQPLIFGREKLSKMEDKEPISNMAALVFPYDSLFILLKLILPWFTACKVCGPIQLISSPREVNISIIRFISSMRGMSVRIVLPLIMGRAQRMATAEFLAELVLIVPLSFLPPLMMKLDIKKFMSFRPLSRNPEFSAMYVFLDCRGFARSRVAMTWSSPQLQ
jgi:hypothetical protein